MARGINQEHLDASMHPGEDFYQFVNGGWLQNTEIPSDRSSWGSFHELSKNTDRKIQEILEDALNTPGPDDNKAARLYETGMDQVSIEAAGLDALKSLFQKTEELGGHDEMPHTLGYLLQYGFSVFLQLSVHPDLGDSKKYAAYLEPASLGLPEREFYLQENEKAETIREKYRQYISTLLVAEGQYDSGKADQAAREIFRLEHTLAGQMMTKELRRETDKLYNPYSLEQLKEKMPEWNWNTFFEAANIPSPDNFIVTEPLYTSFFISHLSGVPIQTLKDYITFLLIHHSAPYAGAVLENAHFELYSKTLEGVEVMRPRNERLVKVVNQSLGELLGQLFVTTYFPPEAKHTAMEMVEDILAAFSNRIDQLEWMSPETKKYAQEKLDSFTIKIGYPDVWKDYSELEIVPVEKGGNYLSNMIAVVRWKFQKDVKRIAREVDRTEWFMAPQVVNAYYNPMFNEIVFPAAILQPPFFDWEADAAVNYGGIGAVIGHEITHGFDDQGSRFDKEGNLNEWWNPEDRARFNSLTGQLIAQFDAYMPFEDISLNGTFTLGENIADLGGLSVAYDALQLYYSRHGKPESIDHFTAEQRFFMSWATVWRTKIRQEALRNQIKTDPHPPGMYRAVAAPSNMDDFYHAFEVIPGSQWYREKEKRIKIW